VSAVLSSEQPPDHLDARLVIDCHDGMVVAIPEEQAEEVARFVEEVMVAGMDEMVNPGLHHG
jgi:DNA polymerase I-like protein with 3'-5' exonuclease and polymerase domains